MTESLEHWTTGHQEDHSFRKLDVARNTLLEHFSDRLIVNPHFTRQLVSFQISKKTPFFRWLKYKEAFSPDLVDYLFDYVSCEKNLSVLDPFAGTGTVLSRAAARGWGATGIELMPVGALALRARQVADRVSLNSFLAAIDRLEKWHWRAKPGYYVYPHVRITEGAFSKNTEKQLSSFMALIDSIADKNVRSLFTLACMSVLEDVSFTRKDGQYLRWDRRADRARTGRFLKGDIPTFRHAIRQRLKEFAEDLAMRNGGAFSKLVKVIEGSCLTELQKMAGAQFDLVVTSPPYCNRYDYTRTYALELAFCRYGEEDFRSLRQTLLSATVENKSKHRELARSYVTLGRSSDFSQIEASFSRQEALHEALALLTGARDKGELSNSNIPTLVENYFFEMAVVVFELSRILRSGGQVFLVNDNVRYHGQEIPVDLILSSLAEDAGLKVEKIWVLPRGKGNSSQQMGRWGRLELRKCVYHWRKP